MNGLRNPARFLRSWDHAETELFDPVPEGSRSKPQILVLSLNITVGNSHVGHTEADKAHRRGGVLENLCNSRAQAASDGVILCSDEDLCP